MEIKKTLKKILFGEEVKNKEKISEAETQEGKENIKELRRTIIKGLGYSLGVGGGLAVWMFLWYFFVILPSLRSVGA